MAKKLQRECLQMFQINKLWIKSFCKKVGVDQFGNFYYVGKNKNYLNIHKRYIVYNGLDEGSKVPPMWHSWLHYLSDAIPDKNQTTEYIWQKEHMPNVTGTKYAYDPAKSKYTKLKTYSSWKPE